MYVCLSGPFKCMPFLVLLSAVCQTFVVHLRFTFQIPAILDSKLLGAFDMSQAVLWAPSARAHQSQGCWGISFVGCQR